MCWTGQGMRWAWAVLGMIWAVHGLGSPRSQLDMGWACDGLVWAFVSHRLGLPWAVISNVWTGPAMGCAEQTTIHSRQAMAPITSVGHGLGLRSAGLWVSHSLRMCFVLALAGNELALVWPCAGLDLDWADHVLGLSWARQAMGYL